MVKVKICGITNLDDALDAVEFGADALGFNFWPDSPRFIQPGQAKKMMEDLPPSVWRVGVFVNEAYEKVRDIAVDLALDYVQFHGDELPSYCDQFATPHWKGFRLRSEADLELMKKYHCDYFLVDSCIEKMYGGTGVTGNWELARKAKEFGKIFLAGGLTPENVQTAIRVVRPAGVDVATGVEETPGRKNRFKLEEFITKAKGVS
ncbi:MAG: phosphoribosylanthranilate isomerase [Deltaproteobacteria bacterium]|nr:phosphoribosylanthranilate isomerase [Deltaproteobacteria bacterium]